MYSKELLKGTTEALILEVLRRHGRMYGYEMAQKIKELSGEKITISEGSLYPLLHRLHKNKVLTVEKEKIGKRVRKYYTLTPEGKSTAKAAAEELIDFMGTLQLILSQLSQNPGTVS